MRNEKDLAANAEVYALVEQVPMDDSQRVRTLATLRSADAFVDGIVWVANGIKQFLHGPKPESKDKHKLAA